jgi:hypothetical protein
MKPIEQLHNGLQFGEITAFGKFLDSVGCSRTTGWRWRTNGWIDTVNIAGRPYVRRHAIDRFLTRAQAGEFSKLSNLNVSGGAQRTRLKIPPHAE